VLSIACLLVSNCDQEAILLCGVAKACKNLIHVTNNEGERCGANELVSWGKILPRWPAPRQVLLPLLHLFQLKFSESFGLGHSLGFFGILLSARNYSEPP